jgi:hypothetical protein
MLILMAQLIFIAHDGLGQMSLLQAESAFSLLIWMLQRK